MRGAAYVFLGAGIHSVFQKQEWINKQPWVAGVSRGQGKPVGYANILIFIVATHPALLGMRLGMEDSVWGAGEPGRRGPQHSFPTKVYLLPISFLLSYWGASRGFRRPLVSEKMAL